MSINSAEIKEEIELDKQILEGYEAQIKDCEKRISGVESKKGKKKQQIADYNTQIEDLNTEIVNLNTQKKSYEDMNVKINEAIINLTTAKKQYDNGYRKLKQYYSSDVATKKLIKLNNENKKVEDIINDLKLKILEESKCNIQTIEKSITSKQNEIYRLNGEITKLNGEIENLDTSGNLNNKELEKLKKNAQSLRDKIKRLENS